MKHLIQMLLLAATLQASLYAEPIIVHSQDAQAIEYLDSIDESYKIDKEGRVISISLSDNYAPANEALQKLALLRHVENLDVWSRSFTDEGLQHLREWKRLRVVYVCHPAVTGRGLKELIEANPLPQLVDFCCPVEQNADVGLQALSQVESLRALSLSHWKIGDPDLISLSKLKNLEELDLNFTKITSEGLQHLVGLKYLRKISLEDTLIGDVGLAYLAELPDLEVLYVNGTPISDKGLVYIGNMKWLRRLSVGNSAVTDNGVAHLANLTHLESLHIDRTAITDSSIEVLIQMKSLEDVHIDETKITPAGARRLMAALPHCGVLYE